MKLLAWDTSSKVGAIAAVEWDPTSRDFAREGRHGLKLVAEWTLNVDAQQSDGLLWGIDRTLQAARWQLKDVDLFGVGVGPGSFTGLRIGVTTARTLSHSMEKPLIGVSSLAALARPAALWLSGRKQKTYLVASTDACKGELYAFHGIAESASDCVAMADGDTPGLWKRGVEESVVTPDELSKTLKKKIGRASWLALGEGRSRYPELWDSLPAKQELKSPAPFADQVQGRYVAMLAWEAHQAGLDRDGLKVHPRYVRAADAEIKLKARLKAAKE